MAKESRELFLTNMTETAFDLMANGPTPMTEAAFQREIAKRHGYLLQVPAGMVQGMVVQYQMSCEVVEEFLKEHGFEPARG
jgi:hypothetical protein